MAHALITSQPIPISSIIDRTSRSYSRVHDDHEIPRVLRQVVRADDFVP